MIVIVLWLFLVVQSIDMQCEIVVFPGHTHLFFIKPYIQFDPNRTRTDIAIQKSSKPG